MWREYQILSKNSRTIVYLPEEDVYGEIKQEGAHASLVYYYIDGIILRHLKTRIFKNGFD